MKIMSQYFPFLSANRVKVQKAWRTTAQDDFKKNAGIFPPFIKKPSEWIVDSLFLILM